jgi:hypothetical protein
MFDLAQMAALVVLSIGEYASIRSAYYQSIEGSITEYFYTPKVTVVRFRNQVKRAMGKAFSDAFDQGYVDGGGELPASSEDGAWLWSKEKAEMEFIDDLFFAIRDLKKTQPTDAEMQNEAANRAEGYCRTLDGIYSQGKARGAGDTMLTFGGNDGAESCATCQKLKGQEHPASWWKNHDLLIYRGNQNYECGCWQCQHILYSKKGEVFTA